MMVRAGPGIDDDRFAAMPDGQVESVAMAMAGGCQIAEWREIPAQEPISDPADREAAIRIEAPAVRVRDDGGRLERLWRLANPVTDRWLPAGSSNQRCHSEAAFFQSAKNGVTQALSESP